MSRLIAHPWWVNLLSLVPLAAYCSWRGRHVRLTSGQLVSSALFATAFGFVEAMVVVYLRAAAGLLPGYWGARLGDTVSTDPQRLLEAMARFPQSLLTLETFREIATILMLLSVAVLSSGIAMARIAVFLWMFAIWDIVYYAALWITIRWPVTLGDQDVLFLIPVPWLSPVWFPLFVSSLAIASVLLGRHVSTTRSQGNTGQLNRSGPVRLAPNDRDGSVPCRPES